MFSKRKRLKMIMIVHKMEYYTDIQSHILKVNMEKFS